MRQSRNVGDIRLRLETEADIRRDEAIRRGVRYSAPNPPSYERLALESLRDDAIAARIQRAANARNGGGRY